MNRNKRDVRLHYYNLIAAAVLYNIFYLLTPAATCIPVTVIILFLFILYPVVYGIASYLLVKDYKIPG